MLLLTYPHVIPKLYDVFTFSERRCRYIRAMSVLKWLSCTCIRSLFVSLYGMLHPFQLTFKIKNKKMFLDFTGVK